MKRMGQELAPASAKEAENGFRGSGGGRLGASFAKFTFATCSRI